MRERDEEIVNAVTHLISGIICVFIAYFVLTSQKVNTFHKIGFLPMIGTSIWTFYSSYVYHITQEDKLKERNRKVDKAAIYLMILGCGLSTCLVCENLTIAIVSSITLIVVIGSMIVWFCVSSDFPEWLSLSSYIISGLIATFPAVGVFSSSLYTDTSLLLYLMLSGIFYCTGNIFYVRDSIKWNHTIWHVFVMLGAGTHIFMHVVSITT